MTDETNAVERFSENLAQAVKAAAGSVVSRGQLAGIALCTDDDLRTAYLVACTGSDCDSADDPSYRFLPVEWDLEPEETKPFQQLASKLSELADGMEDLRVRRAILFGVLVGALQTLRPDPRFDEVLLLVVSTDPGRQLTQLAESAVARLNSPAVNRDFIDADPMGLGDGAHDVQPERCG